MQQGEDVDASGNPPRTCWRCNPNRAIDGLNQSDFLLGKSETSNREGFPVYVADRLEAIKWRNWKIVFYDEQRDWWTPPTKLGQPKAFDLITDPKENIR